MIHEYEQPLNPPGINAAERKIVRQYVPRREYDDVEANGYHFVVYAEVEAYGCHDEDIRVSDGNRLYWWDNFQCQQSIPAKFLDSYISPTGETWRTLIEREVCRQAALLPCTAWEVEYEG
jgi:hypothetical protein